MFEVRQSNNPDANFGLFAACDLKAPIVLCYGGILVDESVCLTQQQQQYVIKWAAKSKKIVSIPVESGVGWLAAMVNEPKRFDGRKTHYDDLPTNYRANCAFGECNEGVFLIVCYDLSKLDLLVLPLCFSFLL